MEHIGVMQPVTGFGNVYQQTTVASGNNTGFSTTLTPWHQPDANYTSLETISEEQTPGKKPRTSDLTETVSNSEDGWGDMKAAAVNGADGDAVAEDEEEEDEEDADDQKHKELSRQDQHQQKQSQLATTLKWLTENYERADGVCLPRCVLYTHYLDFCKKQEFTPAGAATFGKVIRQKFPKLTTRRLGTRGQSKYHYYGIGIKETSVYYHSVYAGKGLTRFSGIKIKTEGSSRKYSLSSKTGTLLPEFPDPSNLVLPEGASEEKVHTFVMMYRTHCQRILDTVISANFDEVQNFLLHFWQGMPDHLLEVLELDVITDLAGLSDSILYKVLTDVLIPSTIQDLPDSLSTEIRVFTRKIPGWLENAMENVPEKLKKKKMSVVREFVHSIRRQISFIHLAQTARSVLLSHESVNQMVDDLAAVEFDKIFFQASFIDNTLIQKVKENVYHFYGELKILMKKQAPIESYTEWMDGVIDTCVLQESKSRGRSFKDLASEFLLLWSLFGSLIVRDLTLHSAASFGPFHLLHIMFDEYVFLVMETQQAQVREMELQQAVRKSMKNGGEIVMHAKVRTASKSGDKSKKRRHEEDTEDNAQDSLRVTEHRPSVLAPFSHLNGTAFARPFPSNFHRDSSGYLLADDPSRATAMPQNSVSISPLKQYPSISTTHFDRTSYFSHLSFGGLPDYSGSTNSFRVPSYPDAHAHGQALGNFSMPPTTSPYWSEARNHSSLADPYGYSTYNKYAGSLADSYSKNSALLSGTRHYQDSFGFNRSPFETPRSLYTRPHETFNGAPLSMQSYGGNFMEIAPSSGPAPNQYGRQDPLLQAQEDFYNSNMSTAFSAYNYNKPYMTPFR
ncbi:DNA-binding protein RFX6 [Lingula anatina]|uniref:DNA-binding protein RFX6 n=1 Tax=Lingula anatina TaxID=7574 RepID=A0A1S3JAM0_LINAN|nr:DNA-binding protein RFX6 [Lingula anatina]|eukprot:XP_013406929.1 DNA-binding protein RFX6 [Lingula anatina]